MKLVVVESPTKTKSLEKYLGKDYQVLASMGHIRDLPKSKMGIAIKKKGKEYTFEPDYVLSEDKGKQVSKLKAAAKKASEVILATDPDREGEAIAFHVKEALGKDAKKIDRIVFHSITKDAVLEAMTKPRKIDQDMVDAQQARRVLDRIVGYELSPVLWKKVRRGLSAGRVQSVALRMIVEREREIEAFKPDEYWIVSVEVSTKKGDTFLIELLKIDGKKAEVKDEKKAKEVEGDLKSATYLILSVEKKERKAYAHPPFKTSTLQQAAANVLGWTSKKTMSVAQKLYEQGNITYHRTDSLNLAPVAIDAVRDFVKKEFGDQYLPASPVFYKTSGKVVAQEAHEAIRPADMSVGTHTFIGQGKEAKDQEKLYGLIWRRTIACQMKEAIFDATRVVVEAKGKKSYQLVANGEVMKFDGWRKLYKKEDQALLLPEVASKEELKQKKVNTEQKFTQPPPRFNDASLVKELEKRGIGRPSTYASIISTIMDRGYVERQQRRFFATKVGMAVVDFLLKNFPTELDYDFTAKMEDDLDDIARGKINWNKMLSVFYGPFEKKVGEVAEKAERVEIPVVKLGKKCPDCKEGELVIREGRFGKFISCGRFPECKYKDKYVEYVEGFKCEKCGSRMVVKKTRFGREFYGCETYPKCDFASWKKPVVEGEEETDSSKNPSAGEGESE